MAGRAAKEEIEIEEIEIEEGDRACAAPSGDGGLRSDGSRQPSGRSAVMSLKNRETAQRFPP